MNLINGKKIAEEIQAEIQKKVATIEGRKPGLTFILVGENPASQSYVRSKKKACANVGIESTVVELPASIAQSDLLKQIDRFNRDPKTDGILVQLPLPEHIDEKAITAAIDPAKDVDGFHPVNVGKMLLGDEDGFLPCTPHGIKVMLERSKIAVAGKHVVIVGRSNIVGKPLAAILMQKRAHCNATVTVAHSQSEHLAELTRSADILVAAIGKPHFIKREMVKPGATVIDVGINRLADGRLVGDVDFKSVSEIAGHITPVPGGVGPMTIAMLLQNTLLSFLRVFLLLFLFTSCQRSDRCTHFEGSALKSPYHVTVGKELSRKERKEVISIIESCFVEVDQTFAEISRLNAAPQNLLIPLSPPLQDLLTLCEKVVELSGGRFDISIHNGIFKKDRPGLKLALSGVCKGQCIDRMVEKLQKMGIDHLLVEWAGEMRAIGHHPLNRDWVAQINPAFKMNNQPIAPIPLRNSALATSINQIRNESSVAFAAVIAPTCAFADALATAAIVFQNQKDAESWAQEVVNLYPDVSFWILSHVDY